MMEYLLQNSSVAQVGDRARKLRPSSWQQFGFLTVFLLVLTILAFPAQAFRLSPISMTFDPTGRGAVKNFEVVNPTGEKVAIEISMAQRSIDIDGKETLVPEDENFVVFPAQVILEAGSRQKVQVRWIGDPAPKSELAYRIIAEQLPVELDRAKAGGASIRILVKYEGSVYIAPKDSKANVQLESVKEVDRGGKVNLEVILANQGNAHGIIRDSSLTLTDSSGKTRNLSPQELTALNNINLLADSKRRLLLPWPDDIQSGGLKGNWESKIER